MKMIDLGEYGIHAWIREHAIPSPLDPVGIGDDCAVLDILSTDYLLITSDRVPLGVTGKTAGQLCVVQNFSDIVAKGGVPIGLLLDVYLPRDASFGEFEEVFCSAQAEATKYGAAIIGGDVKEDDKVTIVGTAVGRVEKHMLMSRKGARDGDIVAISLTGRRKIGGCWAFMVTQYFGLEIPDNVREELRRQCDSSLKVGLKEALAAAASGGITSCIDMSDGLGGALQIISNINKVGFELQEEPLVSCLDPIVSQIAHGLGCELLRFVMSPGYDWELLFTAEPSRFEHIRSNVRSSGGDLIPIGRVTDSGVCQVRLTNAQMRTLNLFCDEKFKTHKWKDQPKAWLTFPLLN